MSPNIHQMNSQPSDFNCPYPSLWFPQPNIVILWISYSMRIRHTAESEYSFSCYMMWGPQLRPVRAICGLPQSKISFWHIYFPGIHHKCQMLFLVNSLDYPIILSNMDYFIFIVSCHQSCLNIKSCKEILQWNFKMTIIWSELFMDK